MYTDVSARCRIAITLLFLATLAGCGGGGGATPPTMPSLPASTAPPNPQRLNVISTGPNNAIAVTGTIIALQTGGFQIEGGSGLGYYNVATNSSTNLNGFVPAVGDFVEAQGTGTPTTSMTASSVTLLSLPSQAITLTGQVTGNVIGGFALQNGSKTSVYPIYSTKYTGPKPVQIGEYVSVSGLGNAGGTLVAKSITQITQAQVSPMPSAAPTPVPTSAPSTAPSPDPSPSVNATSSPVPTAAPTPVPTAAPTPVPTPTPTPVSSYPTSTSTTHVLVAGYIYGYAGTPTTVPLSSIVKYVDWAFTSGTYAPQLRSAGIRTLAYKNWWRNYTSDYPTTNYTDLAPGGAHAAAEARNCSGTALYDPTYGGGYEADARSSAALGHAQVVIGTFDRNTTDALYSDDTAAVGGMVPCNYNQSTYDQATNAVDSAIGLPMFINALGASSNPSTRVDLVQPANVLGAECEICYGGNSNGDYVQGGWFWANIENAEIGTVAQHKIFWDYARVTGDPSSEIGLRNYVYASFLLTYDPGYTMFEEAFHTGSGFPVMPESGLVPLYPKTTASSVSGYQTSSGAYVREWAACYYRGSLVGACAVAVNPGSTSVSIPLSSYHHSLVLSGSGVLDGGTAGFSGPQVQQLGATSAAILFP